jgi:hypothetical protein
MSVCQSDSMARYSLSATMAALDFAVSESWEEPCSISIWRSGVGAASDFDWSFLDWSCRELECLDEVSLNLTVFFWEPGFVVEGGRLRFGDFPRV